MKCPCGKDHTRGAKVADPAVVQRASQEFRRLRAMVEPEGLAEEIICVQGDHRDGQSRVTARVLYTENGREAWTADMCDRHATLTGERFIREGRRGVQIMPAGWTPPPTRRAAEAQRWEVMGDARSSPAHLYAYEMSTDLATPPVIQARPGWGFSDVRAAYQVQADVYPQIQVQAEAAHRFLMEQERGRSR